MNFNQLVNQLRILNPGIEIKVMDPRFNKDGEYCIYCSYPLEGLTMPPGVYIKEDGVITNANFADPTKAITVKVESTEKIEPGQTYPLGEVDYFLDPNDAGILARLNRLIEHGNLNPLRNLSPAARQRNIREIAIELQRINPGVDIKIGKREYFSSLDIIFCDVPINELALPYPFRISRKHPDEITDGVISFRIGDIKKVLPQMLEETRYDLEREEYLLSVQDTYQRREKLIEWIERRVRDFRIDEDDISDEEATIDVKNEVEQRNESKIKGYYRSLNNRLNDLLVEMNPSDDSVLERRYILALLTILDLGRKAAKSKMQLRTITTEEGFKIYLPMVDIFKQCFKELEEIQRENGVSIELPKIEKASSELPNVPTGPEKINAPHLAEEVEHKIAELAGSSADSKDGSKDDSKDGSTASSSTENQTNKEDSLEQLARFAREGRTFEILQRERQMAETANQATTAAVAAGVLIIGTAASIYMGGNTAQIIQDNINSLYSWPGVVQYLQDLGPLSTMLTACSAACVARAIRLTGRLRRLRDEFIDFNAALEQPNGYEDGGVNNARTR